jgi:hypothetical protein
MTPITRYEEIADRVIVQMSHEERLYLNRLMDEPTNDYKDLVVALNAEGCEFPRQQAALMLRNTPGAAQKIIAEEA